MTEHDFPSCRMICNEDVRRPLASVISFNNVLDINGLLGQKFESDDY